MKINKAVIDYLQFVSNVIRENQRFFALTSGS